MSPRKRPQLIMCQVPVDDNKFSLVPSPSSISEDSFLNEFGFENVVFHDAGKSVDHCKDSVGVIGGAESPNVVPHVHADLSGLSDVEKLRYNLGQCGRWKSLRAKCGKCHSKVEGHNHKASGGLSSFGSGRSDVHLGNISLVLGDQIFGEEGMAFQQFCHIKYCTCPQCCASRYARNKELLLNAGEFVGLPKLWHLVVGFPKTDFADFEEDAVVRRRTLNIFLQKLKKGRRVRGEWVREPCNLVGVAVEDISRGKPERDSSGKLKDWDGLYYFHYHIGAKGLKGAFSKMMAVRGEMIESMDKGKLKGCCYFNVSQMGGVNSMKSKSSVLTYLALRSAGIFKKFENDFDPDDCENTIVSKIEKGMYVPMGNYFSEEQFLRCFYRRKSIKTFGLDESGKRITLLPSLELSMGFKDVSGLDDPKKILNELVASVFSDLRDYGFPIKGVKFGAFKDHLSKGLRLIYYAKPLPVKFHKEFKRLMRETIKHNLELEFWDSLVFSFSCSNLRHSLQDKVWGSCPCCGFLDNSDLILVFEDWVGVGPPPLSLVVGGIL